MNTATRTVCSFALLFTGLVVWAANAPSEAWNGVGIEEHRGSFVPLDASFINDDGTRVTLGTLLHAPTVLAPAHYRCPNASDSMLTGIASVLQLLPAEAGRDYQVVTMTIDPRETVADALRAKRIGIEAVQATGPVGAWRFFTGSEASINAVARAVGFHYVRKGDEFDHPPGLVILSPQSGIVRYMPGNRPSCPWTSRCRSWRPPPAPLARPSPRSCDSA